jgi:hypothetical protein
MFTLTEISITAILFLVVTALLQNFMALPILQRLKKQAFLFLIRSFIANETKRQTLARIKDLSLEELALEVKNAN